ncbi:MAG: MFS transporter [Gammaproteobacteria bacterium]|jgi:MFS family permease|nr:MFS transporter [Chromatiales bacterium]MDP6674002.1 MFS transporter [Gammaproteobacteria bacterium]
MEKSVAIKSLGPIQLAPGVQPGHVLTKLVAAFVGIAMLSGVSLLNAYLLTEHLNLPRGQQGAVTGDLSFWTEVVALCLFYPFGMLADRIGRRPVISFGLFMIGIGYGLMPFATTTGELLGARMIYAVGMAATAGILATLSNDYPQEQSRGKLIALSSMANILGAMFMAGVIGRIPSVLADRGYDAVAGGKVMFLTAATLCLVTVIVTRFGLKAGTPVARHERADMRTLITSGLRSAKNPRIALAYAGAFAARGDLVIKAAFLALWAIQDGVTRDMNPGQAMARFGIMMIIMNAVSFFSAPIFGWLIDRVNRVTATIIALIFASTGYLSMSVITSPLDFAMVPFFVVLALGSSFMMKSSLSLVGQEAPIRERGSVFAMNSISGAIGILVFLAVGGRLFDAWAPWAPFVLAGAYQALLLVVAIAIRLVAPGRNINNQSDPELA